MSSLARLFKKSRDIWKKRSFSKQARIKSLEIKVRDLSKSRERWKSRAKALISKLSQSQTTHSTEISEPLSEDNPQVLTGELIPAEECSTSIPVKHRYPVYVIQLAIEPVIVSLSRFRGIHKTFKSFAPFFGLPVPSFSCIRNWVHSNGLYQLLSLTALQMIGFSSLT